MRVLVACEFSGVVRRAFRDEGHEAFSCDLLEADDDQAHHIRGDALLIATASRWDMIVAFPPCTHVAVSGARWFKFKRQEQAEALLFMRRIMELPIRRIAMENPVGVFSTHYRKPDQIIQPWQFGHGETKATCLWLKGLPLLEPTEIVPGREPRVHRESPGPDRWKRRSLTYEGIAKAMATQWGEE